MSRKTSNRRLPALTAAFLIGLAMPLEAVVAKEKTKAANTLPAFETSVVIPTIDAVGSSLSESELADILSGNIADHASDLADLDASSIAVPEITVTITGQSAGEPHQAIMTFSGLQLDNIVDGKADAVSLDSMSLEADDVTFNFGTVSAANLDIGGLLGIYGLVDASGQTELEVVYTDLAAAGGSLESEEVSCTLGNVAGAEFKGRPLKTSFAEIMSMAQAMEDEPDTVDPVVMGKFLKMYADILTAFETSELTFGGMSCNGVDDDGKPMTIDLAGMSMGAMSPGTYPSMTIEGFKVTVEGDGAMALDQFTFKPMDLTSTIATLVGAPDAVDEAWLEANARALIPAMEGLSLRGLDIDLPDPDTPDSRIQAKVGEFDLSLASYFNGIPTDFDMSASGVQAEIPANSGDETFEQLRALGITDVDAGFRIAAAWNAASSSIAIEEVSMSGVDLATIVLAGLVNNATEDLYALDPDTALAAAMGLAVKSLDLTVTDAGLSDIVLSVVAAEQGADPATLRPVFAGLAQGTVISMMAGAADAAKLGEAINAFVSGTAKTLQIGIAAKADPGLGMMDFMAAEEDPTTLLGKVDISATAK